MRHPIPHLHPVPSHEVGATWHVAEPWIADAIQRQAIRDTAETFRGLCADGSAQLWLVIDGGVAGAILTEIYDTTKGKTCHILAAAGRFLDHGDMSLDMIERWARAEGCVRIEETGRRGWLRALKRHGWREAAVIMEKNL